MLILAHPTGNNFVRNLAQGMADENLLAEFWTCLDYPEQDSWLRFLPNSWLNEAKRRKLPHDVKPYTHLQPLRELGRLLGHRVGLGPWISHENHPFSVDGVYRGLDKKVSRRLTKVSPLQGVYLYEDGADQAFQAARAQGIHTFYDLPIGYWRAAQRILGEEAALSPDWAMTMKGNQDSSPKLDRKDRELALADTVFVASSFTRSTLSEATSPPQDIVLVPYGSPEVMPKARPSIRQPDDPLRVLFVGSLGQRKGIRYLLEAMALLGAGFELTLIGKTPPNVRCNPLTAGLLRHRHISSLPHAGILEEMRRHHVLVFPSLFEGFGLVLTEAMACGLPIVATSHTAAPDLISDGKQGYIIPIRSSEAIAEKLSQIKDDENYRQEMGLSALARARELTWEKYRRNLTAHIRQRLSVP